MKRQARTRWLMMVNRSFGTLRQRIWEEKWGGGGGDGDCGVLQVEREFIHK